MPSLIPKRKKRQQQKDKQQNQKEETHHQQQKSEEIQQQQHNEETHQSLIRNKNSKSSLSTETSKPAKDSGIEALDKSDDCGLVGKSPSSSPSSGCPIPDSQQRDNIAMLPPPTSDQNDTNTNSPLTRDKNKSVSSTEISNALLTSQQSHQSSQPFHQAPSPRLIPNPPEKLEQPGNIKSQHTSHTLPFLKVTNNSSDSLQEIFDSDEEDEDNTRLSQQQQQLQSSNNPLTLKPIQVNFPAHKALHSPIEFTSGNEAKDEKNVQETQDALNTHQIQSPSRAPRPQSSASSLTSPFQSLKNNFSSNTNTNNSNNNNSNISSFKNLSAKNSSSSSSLKNLNFRSAKRIFSGSSSTSLSSSRKVSGSGPVLSGTSANNHSNNNSDAVTVVGAVNSDTNNTDQKNSVPPSELTKGDMKTQEKLTSVYNNNGDENDEVMPDHSPIPPDLNEKQPEKLAVPPSPIANLNAPGTPSLSETFNSNNTNTNTNNSSNSSILHPPNTSISTSQYHNAMQNIPEFETIENNSSIPSMTFPEQSSSQIPPSSQSHSSSHNSLFASVFSRDKRNSHSATNLFGMVSNNPTPEPESNTTAAASNNTTEPHDDVDTFTSSSPATPLRKVSKWKFRSSAKLKADSVKSSRSDSLKFNKNDSIKSSKNDSLKANNNNNNNNKTDTIKSVKNESTKSFSKASFLRGRRSAEKVQSVVFDTPGRSSFSNTTKGGSGSVLGADSGNGNGEGMQRAASSMGFHSSPSTNSTSFTESFKSKFISFPIRGSGNSSSNINHSSNSGNGIYRSSALDRRNASSISLHTPKSSDFLSSPSSNNNRQQSGSNHGSNNSFFHRGSVDGLLQPTHSNSSNRSSKSLYISKSPHSSKSLKSPQSSKSAASGSASINMASISTANASSSAAAPLPTSTSTVSRFLPKSISMQSFVGSGNNSHDKSSNSFFSKPHRLSFNSDGSNNNGFDGHNGSDNVDGSDGLKHQKLPTEGNNSDNTSRSINESANKNDNANTSHSTTASTTSKKFESFFKNPFTRSNNSNHTNANTNNNNNGNNSTQSPALFPTTPKSKKSFDLLFDSAVSKTAPTTPLARPWNIQDVDIDEDDEDDLDNVNDAERLDIANVPQLKLSTPSMDSLKSVGRKNESHKNEDNDLDLIEEGVSVPSSTVNSTNSAANSSTTNSAAANTGTASGSSGLESFGLGGLSIAGSQRKNRILNRTKFHSKSKEKLNKEKEKISKEKLKEKEKSKKMRKKKTKSNSVTEIGTSGNNEIGFNESSNITVAADSEAVNDTSELVLDKGSKKNRSLSFDDASAIKKTLLSPGFLLKDSSKDRALGSPVSLAFAENGGHGASESKRSVSTPNSETAPMQQQSTQPSTIKSSKSFFSSFSFASNLMSDHSSSSATNTHNNSLSNAAAADQTPRTPESNNSGAAGRNSESHTKVSFDGNFPTNSDTKQHSTSQTLPSSPNLIPFPVTQSIPAIPTQPATASTPNTIASTLKAPLYRFRRKTASMLFSNDNDSGNLSPFTGNHNPPVPALPHTPSSEISFPTTNPHFSSPSKQPFEQQQQQQPASSLSTNTTAAPASSFPFDASTSSDEHNHLKNHPYGQNDFNRSRPQTPTHSRKLNPAGALFYGSHSGFSLHRTLSSHSPSKDASRSPKTASPASSTFQLVTSRPRSRTMSSLEQRRSSTPSGFFSYKHSDTNLISLAAAHNNAELRYGGNNGLNSSSNFNNTKPNTKNSVASANQHEDSHHKSSHASTFGSGSGSVNTSSSGPSTQTRPSTQIAFVDPSNIDLPPIDEDESPATYLKKVRLLKLGGNLAGALARVDDDFHRKVLKLYVNGFHFQNEPLDMSLRKFLISVKLPRETQQIDRVLEAFAFRYHECNVGIYNRPEDAYFVAFSLVLLHTDFFNPNNKFKMQKSDYLKIKSEKDYQAIPEEILGVSFIFNSFLFLLLFFTNFYLSVLLRQHYIYTFHSY